MRVFSTIFVYLCVVVVACVAPLYAERTNIFSTRHTTTTHSHSQATAVSACVASGGACLFIMACPENRRVPRSFTCAVCSL
jgi:hypothetical protein